MMKTQSEQKQYDKTSRTITFRVNSDILAKLKEQAKQDKSTVNALVNRLLLQAINWNIAAAKSDWVPAERDVVRAILDNLNDDMILKIAQMQGKNLPRDICLSMRGDYGLKEWLDIVKLGSVSSGFNLTTMRVGNESVFVMRHDMGKRYSLHSKSFYEQAFKGFGCNVTFETSENTLVFKIPHKLISG